ncbi:MAG: CBS domain-containing protein [Planctomycetes bacterium]|nr:CBS domain-containing protein [Planctomycetota bacterium]
MDPVEQRLKQMKAVHLERKNMVVAPPTWSVRQCLDELRAARADCLLVVDGARLVGIFTERDVLKKIVLEKGACDRPVKEFMTRDPRTIDESATVARAVHEMHEHGFRHLPIMDARKNPVGVVGQMDIVRFLAGEYADKVLNLPPVPDQVPGAPEGG